MLIQILRCLALGALACGLSLVLTPLARWFMRRIGAVDQPDSRRVNKVPIPRGGGLAVVAWLRRSLPFYRPSPFPR